VTLVLQLGLGMDRCCRAGAMQLALSVGVGMGIGCTRRQQRCRRGMTVSGTRAGHGGDIGQIASSEGGGGGILFRAQATRVREGFGANDRVGELQEGEKNVGPVDDSRRKA
jgi:hypothetical protein